MRRWLIVIVIAACGGGKKKAADGGAAEATAGPADLAPLITALERAREAEDPAEAVRAAVIGWCGAACPCADPVKATTQASCQALAIPPGAPADLVWVGKYLGDKLAMPDDPQRKRLRELLPISIWLAGAPDGVQLAASPIVQRPTGWGVVAVGADGAVRVGRNARVVLTDKGAVYQPATTLAAIADHSPYEAVRALTPEGAGPPSPESEYDPSTDYDFGSDVIYENGPTPEEIGAALQKAWSERGEKMKQAAKDYVDRGGGGVTGMAPGPTGFVWVAPTAPCDDVSSSGWGFGSAGLGPGGGTGEGTIGTGRYGTIGNASSWYAYLRRGTPVRRVVLAADAAAPPKAVFEALDGYEHVLEVAGGALPLVVCSAGWVNDGVVIQLAKGGDPKEAYATYEAAAKKAGQHKDVILSVAPDVTYGEIVATIAVLLDAGASVFEISGKMPPREDVGRAKLTIGTAKVDGGLDPATVRRYLKRSQGKFLYCYEKERIAKPTLGGGTVTARLTILPDGRVSSSKTDGIDPDVASCIDTAVNTIAFPKADAPTTITAPLTFRPPA